jgi:hypothetical protein
MSKVKIQIKTVWGSLIYENEKENYTFAQAVSDANMRGANMRGANMRGANMRDANMRGADMRGANMRDADMRGADMRGADMRGADMRDADMRGADMRDADMRGADMRDADMRGADMRGADMRDIKINNITDLDDYLNQCSRDMLFIFEHLRNELPGLRKALVEGKIDGTQYEGDCACLIGTLGNLDGGVDNVCEAIPYYEKGLNNYGEQWFWQIHEGDTPENNLFAAHALKLVDQVLDEGKKAKR